jgi:hypothetical protein
MTRVDDYRTALRELDDWEPYLRRESRLPGPRANLELVQAVVEEGNRAVFERLLAAGGDSLPANNPDEFLQVCGTVGLGRLLAEGDRKALARLRRLASDLRWRIREAVAMALQRWGDSDPAAMFAAMENWSAGPAFVQRAAAAAVCEPRLIEEPQYARRALDILEAITVTVPARRDRRDPGSPALVKSLGYCWSVAVAALPGEGKRAMATWLATCDPDIRRIMAENLKKARLGRMDPAWVARAKARLASKDKARA